jgi:hypothetical protein
MDQPSPLLNRSVQSPRNKSSPNPFPPPANLREVSAHGSNSIPAAPAIQRLFSRERSRGASCGAAIIGGVRPSGRPPRTTTARRIDRERVCGLRQDACQAYMNTSFLAILHINFESAASIWIPTSTPNHVNPASSRLITKHARSMYHRPGSRHRPVPLVYISGVFPRSRNHMLSTSPGRYNGGSVHSFMDNFLLIRYVLKS